MKFKSYIIFFLLFGLVPDLYICTLYIKDIALSVKLLVCLPTLLLLILLFNIGKGVKYAESVRLYSYLTFIVEFPKFIFSVFSSTGRFVFGIAPQPADLIALAVALSVSAMFAVLVFYTTRHLKLNLVNLTFSSLPDAFNGLRICQLSDFHLGSFGTKADYIRQIADKVQELSPDLILFTGDMVNFEASEADSYLGELSRLKAPMGIYSIRGNHDYLMHGYHHNAEARLRGMDKLMEMEKSLGWIILLNEHAILEKDGARFALVGVENVSANPFFSKMGGDLKKAMEGLPPGIFTILLSHDPSHWRSEVVPSSDIPLTLSGHTHGLRYKLAGLHPSHWKLPESGGIYRHGSQVLHVSKGLGSAFAFRLGGFPMIDLITLTNK